MQQVNDDFHARYSAAARYYRYEILNRWVKSALHRDHVTTIFTPLDADKMQQGANHLIGEHDFTSLRAVGCQAKSPIKHMHAINVRRQDDRIIMDVVASAFLHHMVRNIVGTLLPVAKGEKPPAWVAEVLAAKDRRVAGVTARPNGLYLSGIYYPERFGIPKHKIFEPFSECIESSRPVTVV
jgi:tRNA pseudouridine38-40 synthase